MKLTIAAVGRMRSGPEKALVEGYLARVNGAGRALALAPAALIEIDERKARGRAAQTARLIEAAGTARIVALDERGERLSSPEFAALLARFRDRGTAATAFLIGGADGHDPALRDRADRVLSLGPMVWPHMLARAMLAEQIWRAVSILGAGPYHRG